MSGAVLRPAEGTLWEEWTWTGSCLLLSGFDLRYLLPSSAYYNSPFLRRLFRLPNFSLISRTR